MLSRGKRLSPLAIVGLTLLLSSSLVDAQTCTGERLRFFNWIPAYSAGWYYGPWEYFANPSQRLAAAQVACQAYAKQHGLTFAKEAWPASQGYTSHSYRNVTTDGSGCSFTVHGQHPIYGESTGGAGGGNQGIANQCPQDPLKNAGDQCGIGNPINPATGNKYQAEHDYRSADSTLEFTRHYNSQLQAANVASPFVSALGSKWRSTYDRAIRVGPNSNLLVYVYRPDGKTFGFIPAGSEFVPDADITDRLEKLFNPSNVFSGWRYVVDRTDEVEIYDVNGRLLTITSRAGVMVTLAYDGYGRLATVTDPFGKALAFGYDASNRLHTLTVPGGQSYVYSYNANNNVSGVLQPDGTTRSFAYNESAYTSGASLPTALTGIFDESGVRYATFRYNNSLRAVSTEHANGVEKYEIEYPLDPNSSTRTFEDPLGQSRTLTLSTVHGVSHPAAATARSELACARQKSSAYDGNGNATSQTDFNDNETTYAFDTLRNLQTSRTEAAGTPHARTITTQWHATFRLPTQIDEPGKRTTFQHDSNGNVLSRTELDTAIGISRSWTYTYNSYGQVLTANGPRTDVLDRTTYAYYNCTTGSQCGQVHTITNALAQTTTYLTYNAHGQPLTMTDPNGVLTSLAYDLRQRLTSRTVGGETTSFEYWSTGLLKKVTQPDGSHASYSYDAAHRLTGIEDADGNRAAYTLDAMGNRTAEIFYDSSNAPTRSLKRNFDTLNRLWKEIGAGDTPAVTTTYAYDLNGNQTGIAAPLSRNASQSYDELNRLTQVTDPLSGITHYGYDALDRLVSVTDPRNLTTAYTHNALGDLLEQTSPDSGGTVFTYDTAGNISTRTDARGASIGRGTYSHDVLNRVTQIVYPDHIVTYGYDSCSNGIGRLCSLSDVGGTTTYEYDPQGRVTLKAQTVNMGYSAGLQRREVHYTYTNGLITRQRVLPSGMDLYYEYTVTGRVTAIRVRLQAGWALQTVLTDVLYDADGQIRGWTWGNGAVFAREYDADGRPWALESNGQAAIEYDDAGRITEFATDASAPSWTYGYDSLDRLTSATRSGLSRTYSYDANGNRQQQAGTQTSTHTYSNPLTSNRIASVSGSLSRAYQYDAAGNITDDGLTSFTYDGAGRLVGTSAGSTGYAYNGVGQRIVKRFGGSLIHSYVYDEAGRMIEKCGAWVGGTANVCLDWTTQQVIWLDDIPVATALKTVLYNDVDQDIDNSYIELFYINSDHLNTPRRLTRADSSNALIWRWNSDPFGIGAVVSNFLDYQYSFQFDLRFPGQLFDAETGLHYNYYRDYDPSTGRYVQSDPIGLEGGLNTYGYANGNPVSFTDPLGLDAVPRPGIPVIIPPAFVPGTPEYNDLVDSGSRFIDDLIRPIMDMTARGNQASTPIVDDYGRYASAERLCGKVPKDRCQWLEENKGRYRADQVKETQKAWGCRRNRTQK